jgi:hypothetical protein
MRRATLAPHHRHREQQNTDRAHGESQRGRNAQCEYPVSPRHAAKTKLVKTRLIWINRWPTLLARLRNLNLILSFAFFPDTVHSVVMGALGPGLGLMPAHRAVPSISGPTTRRAEYHVRGLGWGIGCEVGGAAGCWGVTICG